MPLLLCRPLVKALAVNATTSAFTAKTAAVLTRPSGNLVTDLTAGVPSGKVPARLRLFPYAAAASNDTFAMRVWGWSRVGATTYVPAILGDFTCTVGAFTGCTGGDVLSTELFVDTIAIVAATGEATTTANTTRDGTAVLYSPANDTPGYVEVPVRGCELVEFDFDQTLNTPAMNCLIGFLEGVG